MELECHFIIVSDKYKTTNLITVPKPKDPPHKSRNNRKKRVGVSTNQNKREHYEVYTVTT